MRWSEYVRGEFWISPDGHEEYADQDVGDDGHERIAIRNLVDLDTLLEGLKSHYEDITKRFGYDSAEGERAMEILDSITQAQNDDNEEYPYAETLLWDWLQQRREHKPETVPEEVGVAAVGGDREIWDLLNSEPRWAYAKAGAILVINQDFACWKVTSDVIKRIQDFILNQAYEAGDIEADDVADLSGDMHIEEYSTEESTKLPINDFLLIKHRAEFWGKY